MAHAWNRYPLNRPGLLLCLILLATCAACGTSASAKPPGGPPYRIRTFFGLAFGPQPEQILDLCLPEGAPGNRPVVLLLHGGAWFEGSQVQEDEYCQNLATQGFVAASVNYRLAPASIWPAQLVDAQLAVRWLRSQASQYHLDPQRFCAYGDSAGAHLALFLGVLQTIHPGDDAGLLPAESPAVQCVVDAFGPTDLTAASGNASNYQRTVLEALFGGQTYQENPAIYADASPVLDVTSASAPMLIIQGTLDTIVPLSQSQELQDALDQVGVANQLITYVGGHGFSGLTDQQVTAIYQQILAYLVQQLGP